MNNGNNGQKVKKGKSKKIKFKKSKDYSPDVLKQKEKRFTKHDRREKLNLLRLDELAEFDDLAEFEELLTDYEELAEI